MRYLRIIPLSLCAAGLLALTGCAKEDPAGGTADGSPTAGGECWVTFELTTPMGEGADSQSPASRAGETSTEKTPEEAWVWNPLVMLVDSQDDKVCGIAQGGDYVIVEPKETTHVVTVNLGPLGTFKTDYKYRLYVFANLPGGYSPMLNLYGKTIDEVGKMTAGSMKAMTFADLATNVAGFKNGLPMGTIDGDTGYLEISVPEGKYTSDSPFQISGEDASTLASMSLTPMCARVDFARKSGAIDYTFPIGYEDAEGNRVNDVYVEFRRAVVRNAASNVHLMPQEASPATPAFAGGVAFDLTPLATTSDVKAGYIPEYFPTVGDGKLAYSGVTYIELEGRLEENALCTGMAQDVRNAIHEAPTKKEASPKLYYFDDGKVQTRLTLAKPADMANWQTLSYDAAVDGYKVVYRHAIRHNAGPGMNEADGKVYPMEYGVVRNHIYRIEIQSVGALPHPGQTATDNVEQDSEDISIRIAPPAKWDYHRGGTITEFNKD